jgi:hypothetical protein
MRLVEAISRVPGTSFQAPAIGAYWKLVRAVALSRYAAGNVQELLEIPAPNQEPDRALLEATVRAAEAEEAAAGEELLAAQHQLLQAAAMPWEGQLPWPVDLPLISPYRTQFDTYYAQRPAPPQVRQIHHSLPHKLRLIDKRFAAVAAAESARDAMLESFKRGATPLTLLLQSSQRMEQSRRAFVESVVDYNERIAEYSLVTVGSGLAPETLVSTLIRTAPAGGNLVQVPRDVRTASGETSVLIPDQVLRR